jgi:hypothetical protein
MLFHGLFIVLNDFLFLVLRPENPPLPFCGNPSPHPCPRWLGDEMWSDLLTVSVDHLYGQVILRWVEFEQYTVFFRNCFKRIHSEYVKKILLIYLRCQWSSYHPFVSNIFTSFSKKLWCFSWLVPRSLKSCDNIPWKQKIYIFIPLGNWDIA